MSHSGKAVDLIDCPFGTDCSCGYVLSVDDCDVAKKEDTLCPKCNSIVLVYQDRRKSKNSGAVA